MQRTTRLTTSALLATTALLFSYIEILIPYNVGIPGVKLGLANLAIIIALYKMDIKYAVSINLIRILLAGLLFSGLFAMVYSLAGGMLSLLVMYLLKRTDKFSMIGVSMAGGVTHNIGQLLIAIMIVENRALLFYAPVLLISGLVTGLLIGYLTTETLKRVRF